MIFITKEELASLRRIEERVLSWFREQGFDGERDRKSNIAGLFPTDGYAELFESLIEMPDLSYQESLDQTMRQRLNSQLAVLDDSELPRGVKREELGKSLDVLPWKSKKLQSLSQVVGSDKVIENLYRAIVQDDADGYPAGRVADGTPDLFLWHPDITLHLWFFVEVKGPRDSLRESQSIWLKKNWEQIQGRIIIVHVL